MKSLRLVFTSIFIILILFSSGCATKKKAYKDAPSGSSAVKTPASVSGSEEFVYEFDVLVDVDPQKIAEPRPDYPESVPPGETRSADSYGQQSQQSQFTSQQSQLSQGAGSDTAGSGTGSSGIAGSGAAGAGLGTAGTTAGSSGVGLDSAGNAAANWGSGTQGSTGSAGTGMAGGVVGAGGLGSADYAAEYAAGFKAGYEAGAQSLAGTTAGNLNSTNSSGTAGGAAAGNQSSVGNITGNINGSAAYVEGYTDGFAAARRTAGGGVGSGTTGSAIAAGTSTASSSAAGFGLAGAEAGSRAFGSPGGPGGRERRNSNLVSPGSVNVEGVMDYIKIRNRNPLINEESTRRIINSYIDEAVKEDVNYDFAIAQMLYWTAFLTNKQRVESNNLAGLLTTNMWGGTFKTPEDGVKAHIQHLRGYSHGTLKNPNADNIDPRWNHISDFRGTIKNFEQIYPRWSANTARYRRNIILILNDMYRYSDRYSSLYR